MPSSHSSRSSTAEMDGEYEWDQSPQDSRKKSRSKVPAEDKLNKRRDQNRVSQRAFRQRKEKHTKELEAKVEELENLLETASHENSMVASQMNRMEEELCYYRRLLFAGSTAPVLSPPSSEKNAPAYTSNYTTSYASPPNTMATNYSTNYATSPQSSTHSSPELGNLPGDFSNEGVDTYWGYDVPATPGYQAYTSQANQGNTWQNSQANGW